MTSINKCSANLHTKLHTIESTKITQRVIAILLRPPSDLNRICLTLDLRLLLLLFYEM